MNIFVLIFFYIILIGILNNEKESISEINFYQMLNGNRGTR